MTAKSSLLRFESANPADGFLSCDDWVNIGVVCRFTTRELEVAVLLFEGRSRSRIARKLRISAETVRVYIDRLYRKLRVASNVGFVLRIVRVHLSYIAKSAGHTKM